MGVYLGCRAGPIGCGVGGVLGGITGALFGDALGERIGEPVDNTFQRLLRGFEHFLGTDDFLGEPSFPLLDERYSWLELRNRGRH